VEATACLPGFYAPTIENEKCYTCPPGTSCTVEGLWEAEECPPGTYRSTSEADGNGCVSCPQGKPISRTIVKVVRNQTVNIIIFSQARGQRTGN
jgi:hypothetical protein